MVLDAARGRSASHHLAAHSPYRSSPVTPRASQSSPTQWPPVQSPCGVVVHSPVAGSAKLGNPTVTRRAVSSTRSSILSRISLHDDSVFSLITFPPSLASPDRTGRLPPKPTFPPFSRPRRERVASGPRFVLWSNCG